ncbi:MAG: endonuclease/exonuclease/phosphatase family protein [Acidobacteriota bacterium]
MVLINNPSDLMMKADTDDIEELTITHTLHPYLAKLAQCQSSKQLRSNKLYQRLQPEIERVLESMEYRRLPANGLAAKSFYRAVAWNIERGICFDDILTVLQNHEILNKADLLLLTETDLGMARSQNRNVARELAFALAMNYYFLPSYINLCKGSGIESDFTGENGLALHGNAILSRYPISDLQRIPLRNAKDKMCGKEKRLGNQQVLAATIQFPQQPLRAVCIHLDALSSQLQRQQQMNSILAHLQAPAGQPVLLAGDWNTSTYNSRTALLAICGFWYRVLMGVGNVITNHYPYPERYFEAGLFRYLKQSGFDYENCNELGVGTNHYHTKDFKRYKNLSDWVPQWCFAFIEWALRPYGGSCSLKLDWFATRDLRVVNKADQFCHNGVTAMAPKVIHGLNQDGKELSDHDPIVIDFTL